jgi:hypothetical protein
VPDGRAIHHVWNWRIASLIATQQYVYNWMRSRIGWGIVEMTRLRPKADLAAACNSRGTIDKLGAEMGSVLV